MSTDPDLAACRDAIRQGSKSFHAASLLLPRRVRDPAVALYAFCRFADDAVDLTARKPAAVLALLDRLDRAYAGRPADAPQDRAFAAMLRATGMPRALPEALIEGFAWDAEGRRYRTLSDLLAYCARVASAVGAMMTVIMGVRDAHALARACDLGAAMQLTNIARDIGEDAAEGRLYLPLDWLAEEGIDPAAFLARPAFSPGIARITARLLDAADGFYRRAEPGIAALPADCRPAILAARLIYAAIGAEIRRAGLDSVTRRAVTSRGRKVGLVALARLRAPFLGTGGRLDAPCAPELAFLVAAATMPHPARTRMGAGLLGIIDMLADLAAREREGFAGSRGI